MQMVDAKHSHWQWLCPKYVYTDTDTYEEIELEIELELEGWPLGQPLTVALFQVSFLVQDDNLALFFTFIFPAIHVTMFTVFTKRNPCGHAKLQ